MIATALVCLTPLAATALDVEVTEGLVGWWRFDGLVDGKVRELTGNGNPAQLMGACAERLDAGRGVHVPNGRGDSGREGYARTSDLPFLRGEPTELTVTAWVWWDGSGGGDAVCCHGRFVLSPNVWEVHCEKEAQKGWHAIQPAIPGASRQWLHIAGVLNSEGIILYRDREVAGRQSVPKRMIGGSTDLDIGRGFRVARRQMPGYIWEVRVYDRSLSADEVASLASVRRPATPRDLPETGLYLPGRTEHVAAPFTQPDCSPFMSDASGRLTITEADVAALDRAGCGLYRRVAPSVWQENGAFELSGKAAASAPVRVRLFFVGWPAEAELRSSSLITRVCGPPLELGPETASLKVAVPVPRSVQSGIVMLAVADRRADQEKLVGTVIQLGRLKCATANAGSAEARAGTHAAATIRSRAGLTLGFDSSGGVLALRNPHTDLTGSGVLPMSGWFVTDYAGDNVPVPLVGRVTEEAGRLVFSGTSQKLKLAYRMEMDGSGPYLDCRADLNDLSGRDRALMLEFRLPLSSEQAWSWHDGGYDEREVLPGRRCQLVSSALTGGGQRKASILPFAAISNRETGMCLGVPLMDEPRLFRVFAYKPFIGDAVLGCEFEVGLSPVTRHFPSRASFRFVIYATEPSWALRRAAAKYYGFFPEQFVSTVKRHGNWAVLRMAQQYTPNLADFAIAVDETVMGSPPADMYGSLANKLLGIPTCPYVRPGTWSQPFEGRPSAPDAYGKRMALLATQEKLPAHTYMFLNPYWGTPLPTLARATRNAGIHDAGGRLEWRWPAARGDRYFMRCQHNCSYEVPAPNWASVIHRQYTLSDDWARAAGVPQGGVYFDNMGGSSLSARDFRRDHWEIARFPLTVNADPPQPVQSKVLQLCEFFSTFTPEVHRRAGLLIGNFNTVDAAVLAQYFDFIGVEGYKGAAVERMRLLAGPKPASYLVHPGTREVFDNCLSYGVAPGFTKGPRQLYREFMPLIVSLSKAGWQPVPEARYSAQGATVERFGKFVAGNLSFTVRHSEQDAPNGVLTVSVPGTGIPDRNVVAIDVRHNRTIKPRWERERLIIPLPATASRTEVVRICRAAAWKRECLVRLAGSLERASREWAWVKAQHDDSLTARLGFEEDEGRWFRDGFEGARVGLSPVAHSDKSALLIEAGVATQGTIKTEPFSTKWELAHRVGFHYRAEGSGRVKIRCVFRPNWFGGDPIGETDLGEVRPEERVWASGWHSVEAEVQPVKGARRTYLQLDFHSFKGRFAMDTVRFGPVFPPLAEPPHFGFAELCAELRAAMGHGQKAQAGALVEQVQGRLETWESAAAGLPAADAARMAAEIAVVHASLNLYLAQSQQLEETRRR